MHPSFWHAVSECPSGTGKNGCPELSREFKAERASKIGWIISTIQNPNSLCYQEYSRGQNKWVLMLEEKYIVVLSERTEYMLFITGYPVDRNHTKEKYIERHNNYVNA